MAMIADLLASQPILALFLAVAVGYAVGQVNIFGFSLGIGAVLFVGLAIGAISPKAQIAGPIGLIGLTMFLYGIGILYGRQFFEGLSGPGRLYNLLAFVAVLASLVVALALGWLLGIETGQTLGVFAGSMTSTPTLQAALDLIGQQGAIDRLLGQLSVRRDRADPLLLRHDPRAEARVPAGAGALPHGRDHDRSPARGHLDLGRDARAAAGRRSCLGRAPGAPQQPAERCAGPECR